MRRRQSKRDGEDNQECVKSIDRSIDRPPFSSVVFLSSSRLSFAILSSRRWCCSFRPRRDKTRVVVVEDTCTLLDARSRLGDLFFSTHTNISPLSLSLSLEQHSMLHRRRVRRGPDHGHDRAEVPAHRGKQRASLIKVVFARFITTSSICIIRLQNARVQNVPVFDTPPGPGGAIFSMTRATQSPKRKDRDERLVALLVVFCRRFSSGVGCSLSLSQSHRTYQSLPFLYINKSRKKTRDGHDHTKGPGIVQHETVHTSHGQSSTGFNMQPKE